MKVAQGVFLQSLILFLRLEEVSGDIQKIRNETRSRLKEAEMRFASDMAKDAAKTMDAAVKITRQ